MGNLFHNTFVVPNAKGAWQISTAYFSSTGDIVTNGNAAYLAINDETSTSLTEPGVGANWTDAWSLLVTGGVGGGGDVDSVFGRTGAIIAVDSDYDASQIGFAPNGTIIATDVQAAIQEVRDESASSSHVHDISVIANTGALASKDTIVNADVAIGAAITESKLALDFDTHDNVLDHSNALDHSNVNDPTSTEKLALPGTSGIASGTNKYVTDADSRNSDARTPLTHNHVSADVTDLPLSKLDATTAPGVSNDNTEGYSVGSHWFRVDNNKVWACTDSTTGAAVWSKLTGMVSPGTVTSNSLVTWDGVDGEAVQDSNIQSSQVAQRNTVNTFAESVTFTKNILSDKGILRKSSDASMLINTVHPNFNSTPIQLINCNDISSGTTLFLNDALNIVDGGNVEIRLFADDVDNITINIDAEWTIEGRYPPKILVGETITIFLEARGTLDTDIYVTFLTELDLDTSNALTGSDGTPSALNKYVTEGDVAVAIVSATEPTSPVDGQEWRYTSAKTTYWYESGRGKWLGDLVSVTFGYNNLTSAKYLKWINGSQTSATIGYISPYPATIVGISALWVTTVAGNLEIMINGISAGTTSADGAVDHNSGTYKVSNVIDVDIENDEVVSIYNTSGSIGIVIYTLFIKRRG